MGCADSFMTSVVLAQTDGCVPRGLSLVLAHGGGGVEKEKHFFLSHDLS